MHDDRDHDAIIAHLLHARRQIGREELAGLVKAVKDAGGTFDGVSYEPGDGVCPEWRFPFPPKGGLAPVIEAAWKVNGVVKIFPKGIINPDGLRVVIAGLGNRG